MKFSFLITSIIVEIKNKFLVNELKTIIEPNLMDDWQISIPLLRQKENDSFCYQDLAISQVFLIR
ncbi:hypothetical protein [Virgibacillus dokdonensis]|uniref:hypothetical protein n=1 Tax=Virgibacillus dokdonensis TaxID=302167 RepID=UPI002F9432C8